MAAGLPPSPALDETIARGQAGLREDAQVVHGTLNLLKSAAGKTPAELAADDAFTGTFASVESAASAVSDALRTGLTVDTGTDAGPWAVASGTGTVTAGADGVEFATTAQAIVQWTRDVYAAIPKGGAVVIRAKRDANLSVLDVRIRAGSYSAQKTYHANLGTSPMPAGEWFDLVFPLAACTTLPSGETLATAQRFCNLHLSCTPAAATDTTFVVESVKVVGGDDTPRVIWQFDDGRDDTYSVAEPILTANGYTGAVAFEYTQAGAAGRMSLVQMQELYAAGWECNGHHTAAMSAMSEASAVAILRGAKDWMRDNGLVRGSDHWVWPGGSRNVTVDKYARRFYRTRRGTTPMAGNVAVRGVFEPYDPNIHYITKTMTAATLKTKIDHIVEYGGTFIIVFHSIVETESATEDWSIAKFTELVEYAAAQGVVGTTYDDTFGALNPATR